MRCWEQVSDEQTYVFLAADMSARSLSGRWMSAPQMAQEFAGLAERRTLPVPSKVSSVNLFLPA